jgi:hypothetical protein
MLAAILFLIVLAQPGMGANCDSCFATIRYLGRSPAKHGQQAYHFSFTNHFSHSVYYFVYRYDVPYIAGEPEHCVSLRRWGCWGPPQVQFRDVRTVFRCVRPGQTITFPITRSRTFWPWRLSILFYPFPDYHALTGEIDCDTILN